MKHNVPLTVVSLLTLILMTIHISQDVILQAEGHVQWPIPVVVFAVWLYATLTASDRGWGYIVMFLGGLFGAGMIVMHSRDYVVGHSGGYFFVWTMFAVAATGWVTMILAARGLWTALRAWRAARPSATGTGR